MSLKSLRLVFHSSSFRFALFTGFTIWFVTAFVLLAVYFKLENTIWRGIEQNLDAQSAALLSPMTTGPDTDVDALIAAYKTMAQSNTMGLHKGEMDMMTMHNTPAMQAFHSSMGIVSPPQHFLHDSHAALDASGSLQFAREVTLPSGETITISQDIDYLYDLQTSLWQSLVFGLSITLLIAVLAAALLTQRSLRRIQQINIACRTVMEGDFSHRVPYANAESRYDDYDQISWHINRMLDEINGLVLKNKQVSDNIAHDLKSPLARLRVQLESANQTAPSGSLDNSIAEVDRLLGMIKSLLGIARIESLNKPTLPSIDLNMLLDDIEEMYSPVFSDKHISLQCKFVPCVVPGDKHLLYQALANLLDNALKFTPENGTVWLNSEVNSEGNAVINIRDTGRGIEDGALEKVFERFYREDSARNASGFGLGLSLVEAIVKFHRGRIRLSNNNGLVVTIELPLSTL